MQPPSIVKLITFTAAASVVALALSPASAGAARLSSQPPTAQAPQAPKAPVLKGSPAPPANPPAVLSPKGAPQSQMGKTPGPPAPPVPTPLPNLGTQGSSTKPPEAPAAQWNFERAWPSKVPGPQPKSDSNEFGVNETTVGPKSMVPAGAKPAQGGPDPQGRVKVKMPWLPEEPPEKMTAPEGSAQKVEVPGWDPEKKEEIKGPAKKTDPPQAEMFNPTEISVKKTVPWKKPE